MPRKESPYPPKMPHNDEVLVVHLGGLGDVCLAESLFLSLREHFGDRLVALGNRRFLDLFSEYFTRTHGVESRHWLYLFSEKLTGPRWKRIVFIGKDREGSIRKRWKAHSAEEPLFIDMYPDGAFGPAEPRDAGGSAREAIHIEAYQLDQLPAYGIEPARANITAKKAHRVILYPEEGFSKEKWPVENFISLFHLLRGRGVNTLLLRPPELSLPVEDALSFEDLSEVKRFFGEGGLFVSNDSGMAHLAAACGLPTITIFTTFNPAIWHPMGRNISLKVGMDRVEVTSLAEMIRQQE